MSRFAYILPYKTAQIHCSAGGLVFRRRPYLLTSLRTALKALLRLVCHRWGIENEWHWVRDGQLAEDGHRYAHRIGAPLVPFLRTLVMNLLRRVGFRSIHAGQQELAHDISRMLMAGGMITA
ncbi:hypothetical protein KBY96_14565 [Cyanobium sp. ATX 6A2]|nr:hypothetical protein [Cyanobium sp. ATX 6A2]